ncbi:histidine phosphatase family protein [Bifidobacterium aemilianum]|uniref:phosphoglycerate mutase (2,3-diphosphoglycerate-dependent) n=1 Tax=Bifidobacterium aemilianum TaxID=2493120 RepID=A0A366K8R3_9BIFI|nr:histidine phosphatase family protein [Bifidobacterium aemilianum]RBP98125.1 histidine phosphatase family protein [Bifidobacterium aemilianum]
MGLPMDLYIMRHGESEANAMDATLRGGDDSQFTEANIAVPDRCWRLTAMGRLQAAAMGDWIRGQRQVFDTYLVSPYTRTRETAALLKLPNAQWLETRTMRERSLGEIVTIVPEEYQRDYRRNAILRREDPMYWRAPAGDSIADVADVRASAFVRWLDANADGQEVMAVAHGDFMHALMMVLEDLSDEEFMFRISNRSWEFHNCICLHYTRRDPKTGHVGATLSWVQTAWPEQDSRTGQWSTHVEAWRTFQRTKLSNEDLMEKVRAIKPHLN